jgi:hypothetical protein
MLRDCPPVRFGPGAAYTIGLNGQEPDPTDLLGGDGLLAVGHALDNPSALLVARLTDDVSVFPLLWLDETAYLDALAAGRTTAAALRPAFDSFADMLDRIVSVHPELDVPARPESRWFPGRHLHPRVRRQLRRLRAVAAPTTLPVDGREESTPAGRHPVPLAIAEFRTFSWPTGYTVCPAESDYPAVLVHADVEPGTFRQDRAWTGILYEESSQCFWILDLADEHPEDPRIYRTDMCEPGCDLYGIPLSERLAELRLLPTAEAK